MITIFTPTYNREKFLGKIYESLKKQKDKNFIWLVIDDGSTDNTKKNINLFISEGIINIKYVFQENHGKHMAFNKALKLCTTKFMICLDSDDFLSDDGVKKINQLCNKFQNDVWGIVGPRVDFNGKTSSQWKPLNFTTMKLLDLYQKYKYIGETYIIMDVNKARKFIFPYFKNENFMPENVLYNRLDELYNILTIDYQLYFSEYLPNGLTNSNHRTFANCLNGFAYSNYINTCCKYSNYSNKVKSYSRFLAIRKIHKLHNYKNLYSNKIKLIIKMPAYILFPLYYCRYKKMIKEEKNEN